MTDPSIETRDQRLARLADDEYDLVVIGGGIFGAMAYWQAALRGYRVALIEQGDYGQGVSANSYKIIHGGIRYMQHLDFPRVISSCRERTAFLGIAPHLCLPLPIIIPTYGHGMLGKFYLGAGCLLYDMVTAFRNFGVRDPARRIPFTRFLSRQQVVEEYPDINQEGLTGGVLIHDGRFYNPTRMVWTLVAAGNAASPGSTACNYLEAHDLNVDTDGSDDAASSAHARGRIRSVALTDRLSGRTLTVRCRAVLNTSGPWTERWLEQISAGEKTPSINYSRDFCFVVDRRGESSHTIAIQGATADRDALVARSNRHLFISPWRDYWLIGVWHKVVRFHPEKIQVDRETMQEYLEEVNAAYPGLSLTLDDVRLFNTGLVPFGDKNNDTDTEDLSFGKRTIMTEFPSQHPFHNMVMVIGLRYTMARAETAKAIHRLEQLGHLRKPSNSLTDLPARNHVPSAAFSDFASLLGDVEARCQGRLARKAGKALAHNHGVDAIDILGLMTEDPSLAAVYDGTTVTAAEVLYICRHEQVESLADVVFRRTDIATAGNPGNAVLEAVAGDVAVHLGWDSERRELEIARVLDAFPQFVDRIDDEEASV